MKFGSKCTFKPIQTDKDFIQRIALNYMYQTIIITAKDMSEKKRKMF